MRLLENWVDEFLKVTEAVPSPQLFRKWGAISTIAGVLERKVWTKTTIGELYPNLYTVLVGPPGVGKSVVTRVTEELWRSMNGLHVAPKSLTKPSLIDALNEAKRTKTVISEKSIHLDFNSLLVNAGELGVLIPQYDSDFMNILTDIYDNQIYEERRRGNNLHIVIKRPQLNIIAGSTPSYLNQTLPEGAWDQGFLSRTFLIFSGESVLVDLFFDDDETVTDTDDFSRLRQDLRAIADMVGPMVFAPEAKKAFREWHFAKGPPRPDHPKLVHYLTRRSAHLTKLCMIASASRTGDRIISLEDYQTALSWLLEAEDAMVDIFRALGAKGDGQVIEEAWHYMYRLWNSTKEAIPEHRLVSFLAERVPSYNVMRIVDIMERSGHIEKTLTAMGTPGWKPKGKSAF